MSAPLQTQAQAEAAPITNKGRFQKGYDPQRHKFTKAECSTGFWSAVESIVCRYPDAIMPDGRHMVVNFMKSVQAHKMVN
jgi:hypothetical protein